MFQSLFLWNWRSNNIPVRLIEGYEIVSILVFVELALERDPFGAAAEGCIEFQSLFLWNWRSNGGIRP